MDGWFSNANSSINIELDKYQFTYMMNQMNTLYTIPLPWWTVFTLRGHGEDKAINYALG